MSPLSYFKITSYQDLGRPLVRILATPLVLYLTFRYYPFGFKSPFILEPAIVYLEVHFSLDSYGLFLLVFPPQLDNPHCLVTQPLSLKRCPQYWRSGDIPLVYSSSVTWTANSLTLVNPLYPTFVVYLTTIHGRLSLCFTEVKQWIIFFMSKNNNHFNFFYKGNSNFSIFQTFVKLFF